jgi:hypothetical protein
MMTLPSHMQFQTAIPVPWLQPSDILGLTQTQDGLPVLRANGTMLPRYFHNPR